MPPNMRPLMRVARLQPALSRTPPIHRAFASHGSGTLPGGTPRESSEQAFPIGLYYESILAKPQPIPEAKPEVPPTSSPKSPRSTAKKAQKAKETGTSSSSSSPSSSGTTTSTATTTATTIAPTVPPELSAEPATAHEKARIIFGSRLAGPTERADRLQSIRDRSTLVAGVLVPPRPDEPDNCCMSGCVDCVWDRYRDELETWASATTRAEEALEAEKSRHVSTPSGESSRRTEEMAKTDRPRIAKDFWDDDLYSNVPVGIREFMKHEKKLKKKHEEEGTFGA